MELPGVLYGFLVVALLPAAALAAPPIEEVRLEYRADACGTEGEFLARLASRTDRFRVVQEKPDPGQSDPGQSDPGQSDPGQSDPGQNDQPPELRRFEVRVAQAATGYVGEVEIEAEGETQARRITAPKCEEALDALALIMALAIDPDAPLVAPRRAAPPASAPPAAVPPARPPMTGPTGDGASRPPGSPPAPRPPEQARWRVRVGLSGALGWGVAPALMGGGGVLSDAALERSRLLSVSCRLAATHVRGGAVETAWGDAAFRLTTLALQLCPLSVRSAASRWGLSACAHAELGQLGAAGRDTIKARSKQRLWAAAGAALRGDLQVNDRVRMEAGAVLAAPLRRDRFLFGEWVFHQVEPVTLVPTLGLLVDL